MTWLRTIYVKLLVLAFGVTRAVYCRVTRQRHLKRWHGPLWRRVMVPILGRTPILISDGDGNRMYIRPDQVSDFIAVFGRKAERVVEDEIQKLGAGEVCVDAGAYIGHYTVKAARRVGGQGKVLAFEPMPQTRAVLVENLRINNLSQVELLPVGLGNSTGSLPFTCLDDDLSIASLKSEWSGKQYPRETLPAQVQTIEIRRLGDLLRERNIQRVDLLKVDVEGFELPVLEGAEEFLAAGKILRIVCEIHQTGDAVPDYLKKFGYSVAWDGEHVLARAGSAPRG